MMKIFDYSCLQCGLAFESELRDAPDCPVCKSDRTRRIYNIAIHGNYRHPIHSDAMAIHPDQRAEHEREFPNIRIDKQNRPIFDNFTDHEACLKKCNLVKVRQKIKPKGKRLTP